MDRIACAAVLGCLAAGALGAAAEGDADARLQATATDFVALLAKGDFEAAARSFDAVMTAAMPVDKLRKSWAALTARAGPFKRQLRVRVQKLPRYGIVLVSCRFGKGLRDVKVVLNRAYQVSGLWYVPARSSAGYVLPEYVKTDFFTEKEVTVGKPSWSLPATLSAPVAPDAPAVVLVHGSGPNDRDETLGPNKPFRDLAGGLASRRIAVLRYEKRTRIWARRLLARKGGFTVWEETVEDALAAVALLRKTRGVNPRKVFVLGHSLGGMLVPRIAAKDPKIAGFVILAGPTGPTEDTLLRQSRYVAMLDGRIDEVEKASLGDLRAAVARVKDPKLTAETPGVFLGAPAKYWLDLRGYDPPAEAARVATPMLVLQGGRDYQVTTEDFAHWKKALGARKDVTLKLYPQLNHLFFAGTGKCTPAEYAKGGHVDPRVIEDIAAWVHARGSRRVQESKSRRVKEVEEEE